MKTAHCDQYRRYFSHIGQICIRRDRRLAAVIPMHTPCVSIPLSRQQAAIGLRQWRGLNLNR